jgi:hypothetical protein
MATEYGGLMNITNTDFKEELATLDRTFVKTGTMKVKRKVHIPSALALSTPCYNPALPQFMPIALKALRAAAAVTAGFEGAGSRHRLHLWISPLVCGPLSMRLSVSTLQFGAATHCSLHR